MFYIYKIDFIYDVSDFILFSSNNCTDKKLNTKTFRNLFVQTMSNNEFWANVIFKK